MTKILFICHGNICRSAAAEMVMNHLLRERRIKNIQVASAATSREEIGNDVYPPMKRALARKGIPCLPHAARQMTSSDGDRFDLIIGMDQENLCSMRRMLSGKDPDRIHLMMEYAGQPNREIEDPWYTGRFDRVLDQIYTCCEGLLSRLTRPRLIFYDIDGTLIDQKTHQIPASALDAMAKAHENGCLNIINSGRTFCNLDRRLEGISIDGWVLGCGTRVILNGETLLNFQWSPEESRDIRSKILSLGLSVVYEGDEALWMEESDPKENPMIAGMRKYAMNLGIGRIIDAAHPQFSFTKFFTFDPDGHQVKRLIEQLAGRFQAIERKDTGIGWEIVPSEYSKGTGIDVIRNSLGVPLENCYVIGDSQNDLPMLTHVPNSIAMGNSEPEVMEACSYVTAAVDQDGIAQALRHFRLIPEKD